MCGTDRVVLEDIARSAIQRAMAILSATGRVRVGVRCSVCIDA